MMAKRRNTKGDVAWYEPKCKRPIAYSTKATSNYIVLLAESGKTINEVYNSVNYNQEAKNILQKYIELGYGNVIAISLFK